VTWLAYSAPHAPFHLPPENLHSRSELTGSAADINANKRDYYLAAIEAMDSEIGRLLSSISAEQLANTVIIYFGDYVQSYSSNVLDVNNSTIFTGSLTITTANDKCVLKTNAIPNYDFNDGERPFPNDVSVQNDTFEISSSPTFTNVTTPISLQTDNALLLNGVKVDLLAAGCFGVGNGKMGSNDMSQLWRYDPMSPLRGFR